MSAAKLPKGLPKGLPKLPPIPAGWDAWKLCGWGGLKRKANGTPWACVCRDDKTWAKSACQKDGTEPYPMGVRSMYYIEAVKRPAKKSAKAKPIKAERLWGHYFEGQVDRIQKNRMTMGCNVPVLVLPGDAESVAKMMQQGALVLSATSGTNMSDEQVAAKFLASIGIVAKKPKKGSK